MGAWGEQPLENDTAWDIISGITDQIIGRVTMALDAGDARGARHAIWLLGQFDARVPAVIMPEHGHLAAWRARLLTLTTAPAQSAVAATPAVALPLAITIISACLADSIEEDLAHQHDQAALGALGILALLGPDIDERSLPSADRLDDWERRFGAIDLSAWHDPAARARAAGETFAALRAHRMPATTYTSLMGRIARDLGDHIADDRLFDDLSGGDVG